MPAAQRRPLSLSAAQARELQQTIELVSLGEVSAVYLPISWLLSIHVAATRNLYQAAHAFLLGTSSIIIGSRAW